MLIGVNPTFTRMSLGQKPVLDLTVTAFETVHGSIRVTGTWFMDPETRESEPCLVLTDATKPLRGAGVIPCIIPLDSAWLWHPDVGDPRHVWRTIAGWLRDGILPGQPTNKRDMWAVFDAVLSRLRDMIAMPPMPAAPAAKYATPPRTVAEVVITDQDTGAVLQEVELQANVRR